MKVVFINEENEEGIEIKGWDELKIYYLIQNKKSGFLNKQG